MASQQFQSNRRTEHEFVPDDTPIAISFQSGPATLRATAQKGDKKYFHEIPVLLTGFSDDTKSEPAAAALDALHHTILDFAELPHKKNGGLGFFEIPQGIGEIAQYIAEREWSKALGRPITPPEIEQTIRDLLSSGLLEAVRIEGKAICKCRDDLLLELYTDLPPDFRKHISREVVRKSKEEMVGKIDLITTFQENEEGIISEENKVFAQKLLITNAIYDFAYQEAGTLKPLAQLFFGNSRVQGNSSVDHIDIYGDYHDTQNAQGAIIFGNNPDLSKRSHYYFVLSDKKIKTNIALVVYSEADGYFVIHKLDAAARVIIVDGEGGLKNFNIGTKPVLLPSYALLRIAGFEFSFYVKSAQKIQSKQDYDAKFPVVLNRIK